MPKFSFKQAYEIMKAGDNLRYDKTVSTYLYEFCLKPQSDKKHYHGVSLDSRTILPGQIFIPFVGANTDGNQFVVQAVHSADSFAMVERIHTQLSIDKQLLVESNIRGLALLANALLPFIKGKKIMITGSAGKTTTKMLLKHILSEMKQTVFASEASYNTILYGVPLTVVNCPEDVNALIMEAGMSEPGTIELIANMIQPDIAVITSIQRCHIGNFEDGLDGIAFEKSQLLHFVKEFAVIPECDYTEQFIDILEDRLIKYAIIGESDQADGRLISTHWNGRYLECLCNIKGEEYTFLLQTPNVSIAMGVIADLLIADYLGLDLTECCKHTQTFNIINGRGALKKVKICLKDMFIYDESYNANLDSMINAIEAFKSMNNKYNIAILGQMNELGEDSQEYHLALLEHLRTMDEVFLFGAEMKVLFEALKDDIANDNYTDAPVRKVYHCESLLNLFSLLQKQLIFYPVGTAFLIKGSRAGNYLDKVVEFLERYSMKKDLSEV